MNQLLLYGQVSLFTCMIEEAGSFSFDPLTLFKPPAISKSFMTFKFSYQSTRKTQL